jgi:hypothetical protein
MSKQYVKWALKEFIQWGSVDGKDPSDKLIVAMDIELKRQQGGE